MSLIRQLLAASVAAFAAVAFAVAAQDESPIPRRTIFGNADRTAPFLSPDGSKIVFTAAVDGVMNIWVGPTNDLRAAKPLTREKRRPIMKYFWARNGTHVLFLQDQEGNEDFRLYSVDLARNTTKDLTPYKKVRAEVIELSDTRPNEVLVGLNNRDSRWHDAWIVNVATGKARLVQKNEGFARLIADSDLNVRLGAKPASDGGQEYVRLSGRARNRFAIVPGDDALTTGILQFKPGGRWLYMFDSRGRDKSALTLVDTATGSAKIVAQSDKADILETIHDPKTKQALAYAVDYDRMSWKALRPDLKADIDFLNKQVTGFWAVLSQSNDNTLWTLWIFNIGEPVKFALFNRKTRSFKILFSARPSLEGTPLPRMHPTIITARDGLKLVSYVTLPNGVDPDGDGIPAQPLPLVLNVHGGPWARDSLSYNPTATWLADRGYAVLSVNFRGSTGFGKALVNAADREWGGKMHDDLIDAVDWAIGAGIASKDRIAIYGASYGGYASLVGLTRTPRKFACGVNIVGPSNLKTWLADIPAYWMSFRNTLKRRVGDPSTDEGEKLLRQRSPLFHADRIQRPLLIAHGANDPRVRQSEADEIVRAMAKNRQPVTYVLYADEGHGFARPENRLSFYAISEAFLAQCLGGRAEPIGDDFAGSSVAVPAGKQHIKGLAEALARP